jgi:acyl-coenzyme A synthetase/AMP-(fatty) acid ligase
LRIDLDQITFGFDHHHGAAGLDVLLDQSAKQHRLTDSGWPDDIQVLEDCGCGQDRVVIYLEDSFAYLVHFHALAQVGAIGVLINSKAPRASALALCQQTDPVGIYTTRSRLAELGDGLSGLRSLRWTETAESLPAPPLAELPERCRYRHMPDDPVSILHSSGTTGLPKAVIQTHASSIAGPRFRLTDFLDPDGSLMMAAQPQSHLGSVMYANYAILAGTPLVALYDPSGTELVEAIRTYRPTTVMAFAHAFAELAEVWVGGDELDSVDGWVTMGDAIHEAHLKSILGHAQSGVRARGLLRPVRFYRAGLGNHDAAPLADVRAQ